jgi:hypothetical protein
MKTFEEIINEKEIGIGKIVTAPALTRVGTGFARVEKSDINKLFKFLKKSYDDTKVKGNTIFYLKNGEAFASYNKKLKTFNIDKD